MKRPTYTDKAATGGDINSRGIEYQKAYMLANLPHWLAHSAFSAVTYELVGDIEVKYFDPEVGEVIDFYQVKGYDLKPAELFGIIGDFQNKVTEGPFRHFYVVCGGLSRDARPVASALDRIRRQAPEDAAAFYPPGTALESNTVADFIAQVVKRGNTEMLARFMLSKVRLDSQHVVNESSAEALFSQTLKGYCPEVNDLPGRQLQTIYQRVRALIEGRRSQPISRGQIISAITDSGELALPSLEQLEIRTLHNETPYRGNAVALPWQPFFGGSERSYPVADEWTEILLGQLGRLKEWLEASASTRNLRLTGQRRLSANIAFGWAFPAVGGYNISHEHRADMWRTDRHPTSDTPAYPFSVCFSPGEGEVLLVSVRIGPNKIDEEVKRAATLLGLNGAPYLELHATDPLTRADQINVAVNNVKASLADALKESSARTIHLFLATPATFALFLGHRLNGVTSVQCYERRAPAEYAPTCLLKAH